MGFQLFLLLAFVLYIAADCPYSYVDGGNGYCYKVFSDSVTHSVASKQCVQDGGRLPYIPNAFTNELVRKVGASNTNVKYIWIGLTCGSAVATSCKWDGSTSSLNSTSYTNFRAGYPYYGPYVFMYTTNGQWVTTTNLDQNNFVCEVPNLVPSGPFCDAGYSYFQGNCYKSIASDTNANAEATCQKYCADLASIHNADENQFITSLASNSSNGNFYTRIGLYLNPKQNFEWIDNTPFNYSNFGNGGNNANFGGCVTLALRNDVVNRGQWISARCNNSFPSVCKKPLGAICNQPTTTLKPPLTPFTCSQTMYLNNNGTIYSPGYPYPYITNTCIYVITVPRGRARIEFSDFNLDPQSNVQLFNDIGDSTPFAILRGDDGRGRTYISTENEMKMIFNSLSGGNATQIWRGYFSSY